MAFTYGIEIEFKTAARQSDVVDAIAAAGYPARAAEYTARADGAWQVKRDGSVNGGWEIVSPVLSMEDVRTAVPAIMARIQALPGAHVDRECGLHVHIAGFGNLEFYAVRNVVRRYINFEDTLDAMQPADRRDDNAYYTRSNIGPFVRAANGDRAAALSSLWDSVQRAKTRNDLITLFCGRERYWKVNLQSLHRHGTIEVRHHAGTIDAAAIVNWVRFLAEFTRVAMEQTRLHKRPAATPETQADRVRKITRAMPADLARYVRARIRENI